MNGSKQQNPSDQEKGSFFYTSLMLEIVVYMCVCNKIYQKMHDHG